MSGCAPPPRAPRCAICNTVDRTDDLYECDCCPRRVCRDCRTSNQQDATACHVCTGEAKDSPRSNVVEHAGHPTSPSLAGVAGTGLSAHNVDAGKDKGNRPNGNNPQPVGNPETVRAGGTTIVDTYPLFAAADMQARIDSLDDQRRALAKRLTTATVEQLGFLVNTLLDAEELLCDAKWQLDLIVEGSTNVAGREPDAHDPNEGCWRPGDVA